MKRWIRKLKDLEKLYYDIGLKNGTLQPLYKFNLAFKVQIHATQFEESLRTLIK